MHLAGRSVVAGGAARPPGAASPSLRSYADTVANKSRPTAEPKKPGRTLKEKRQAKQAKQAAQKQARKGWDNK